MKAYGRNNIKRRGNKIYTLLDLVPGACPTPRQFRNADTPGVAGAVTGFGPHEGEPEQRELFELNTVLVTLDTDIRVQLFSSGDRPWQWSIPLILL